MSFESWAYAHRKNLIHIYKTFINKTLADVDYRTFLKYAYGVSDKDYKLTEDPWYSESDSEDYDYEYSRIVRTSTSLSSSIESEQPSEEIERPIEKKDNDGFITKKKKKESIII